MPKSRAVRVRTSRIVSVPQTPRIVINIAASWRDAELAEQQHRVTQRGIKAGELPAAVDHKRTMGDRGDAYRDYQRRVSRFVP